MAEAAFNDSRMINNGFQDPMGNDAHQGLEHWLDKFHQPTVPSHTIITDPEYFIFLWFHNANGQLINCPYINAEYVPQTAMKSLYTKESPYKFDEVNTSFKDGKGIQGGTTNLKLPEKCIDLTPFVREATLPEIAPANGEDIQTLFGSTSAGSFSPYASDGKRPITLQMLDTEYCILDAIFYPWMKDINSPWWYRPDKVFTEWATPYPMATLEVQRPRMRYRKNPTAQESRNDAEYTYYSYRFVGVKPTSYSAFEINGAGRSNLLRNLSLVADMCIVDLTGDVVGSTGNSTNLGNRTKFIFDSSDNTSDDGTEKPGDEQTQPEDSSAPLENDLDQTKNDIDDNQNDIDQQGDGDMPGEDEPEYMDPDDPDYNPDEYPDGYNEGDDPQDSDSTEPNDDEPSDSEPEEEEEKSPWQKLKEKLFPFSAGSDDKDPNGDKNDDSDDDDEPEDKSLWDKMKDSVSDLGDKIKDAASDAAGWFGDKASEAKDAANKLKDKATEVGKKLGNSILNAFGLGNNDDGQDEEAEGEKLKTPSEDKASGPAADLQKEAKAEEQASNSVFSRVAKQRQRYQQKKQQMAERAKLRSSYGYVIAAIQRDSNRDEDNGKMAPFEMLLYGLLDKFRTDVVAFGVVANSPSSANQQGDFPGRQVFYGGSLLPGMKPAFPFVGELVSQAASQIGTGMSLVNGRDGLPLSQADGALAQIENGVQIVQQAKAAVSALDNALLDIIGNMDGVSMIAKSVLSTGYDVGEFGTLVRKISEQKGSKPTPVESFVSLVTGNDATGATMI